MAYKAATTYWGKVLDWLEGHINDEDLEARYRLVCKLRLCEVGEPIGATKVTIPIDLFHEIIKVLEE